MQDKKRLLIKCYGIVQGVGFRPFVSIIAARYDIFGSVCNKGSFVEIYAQQTQDKLDAFLWALEHEAPPRSVILKIKTWPVETVSEPEYQEGTSAKSEGYNEDGSAGSADDSGRFVIVESSKEEGLVFVSPDIATCPDCERELRDPQDKRYLHPFINCTQCGPRLTILDSMPYDRVRTSMAEFPMCPECEYEYTHAETRRYHAQPVCCNECGPELYVIPVKGKQYPGDTGDYDISRYEHTGGEAIRYVRKLIRDGKIVAIKGIGGFHLCCDATSEAAVARLRELKRRPYKPFAVMMRNMDIVDRECLVVPGEEELLTGPQKPIILLERRTEESDNPLLLAQGVAPGNPNIGVMLPYAPVQMLIFDYPDDGEPLEALVMTSGNPSGAPICMNDEEAIQYLSPMCDAILSNPRKIRIRADDSVMSFYDGKPYMIRRSRGYAPLPKIMPNEIHHSVLGIGGELKNTFCLAKEDMYYASPYIGDMEDARSVRALEAATERLERLLEIEPEAVACDLHPKYNTAWVARKLADDRKIPIVEIQHHYAHVASCMAENEYDGKVIGVSFDGTGYGTDGSIWGGEFLLGDLRGFERLGSIEPFIHAGGDAASRECWRIAVSLLGDAGVDNREEHSIEKYKEIFERIGVYGTNGCQAVSFMIKSGINSINSTSAGRLFDAVSAILGIKSVNTFEGEAAMALEFAAQGYAKNPDDGWRYVGQLATDVSSEAFFDGNGFEVMTTELVKAIAERSLAGDDAGMLAYAFHEALARMIVQGCELARERTGVFTVALTGGVFQNRMLLALCDAELGARGFEVLKHSLVPANDGGICIGQAAVAMEMLKEE